MIVHFNIGYNDLMQSFIYIKEMHKGVHILKVSKSPFLKCTLFFSYYLFMYLSTPYSNLIYSIFRPISGEILLYLLSIRPYFSHMYILWLDEEISMYIIHPLTNRFVRANIIC